MLTSKNTEQPQLSFVSNSINLFLSAFLLSHVVHNSILVAITGTQLRTASNSLLLCLGATFFIAFLVGKRSSALVSNIAFFSAFYISVISLALIDPSLERFQKLLPYLSVILLYSSFIKDRRYLFGNFIIVSILPGLLSHYLLHAEYMLLKSGFFFNLAILAFAYLGQFLHRKDCEMLENERKKSETTARLSAIGEISIGIAHEIRNPTAVIDGVLRELKRKNISDENIQSKLQKIESMNQRITKIITTMSRMGHVGQVEPFQLTSLSQVVDDVVELTSPTVKKSGVSLITDVEKHLRFECRPFEIVQVVTNLVQNGIHAAKSGQSEEKWVRLTAVADDMSVCVYVDDSGDGFAKEVETKILEPFVTTKSIKEGTGLGLSISNSIIKSHMGVLNFERKGHFTRFSIRLPRTQNVIVQKAA
ncbi:MAG: HAMP domain-containing histidine kinase [Bdellovibrionales bacterium]|nr:HAMP domain-containing histidine kinase [Bdellovibrionales bacterium]